MDTHTLHDTSVPESNLETDTDTLHETTVPDLNGDPGEVTEAVANDNGTLEENSSDKEVMRKVGRALNRLDLDLACSSEKLFNMNLLMMRVAAREGDFEAFASEKEGKFDDTAGKALEFDILSGIFDSEVKEMDKFIRLLQIDFENILSIVSSHKNLGEAFSVLKERLHDAEESMKQSQEQVSELMEQSAKFQGIVSSYNRVHASDEDKDVVISEDDDLCNKIQMQTSGQQRQVLRMLEKSIARELDLEQKLTDCTKELNEMKLRRHTLKQVLLSMEEETSSVYAKYLEADSSSVVLMGKSKELISQLQICQFKIMSALQRESELNSRLENCMQAVLKLEKNEALLREISEKNSLEALTLREKVNTLEEQLKAAESELLNRNASDANSEQSKVKELEEKLNLALVRAEKAEEECKVLAETNKELSEELASLKGSGVSSEKVESLEKQLIETNTQLQQAITFVEASQEKQSMLYSSISDMDNLIENLKSKVSKADARADSAEDKCIILSENNAELNEELNFLRGKLESLETALQQAEVAKMATAKDINIRTKMITDLVMELAIERERLHNQISLLVKENRTLVDKLHMANKTSSDSVNRDDGKKEKGVFFSDVGGEESKGKLSHISEVERSPENVADNECESDTQYLNSKLETVRTIDAGRLMNFKYVVVFAVLVALIAVLAVCFQRPESCPFDAQLWSEVLAGRRPL